MRLYLKPKMERHRLLRLFSAWHNHTHFTLTIPLPGFKESYLDFYGHGYGIWRRGPLGLFYWARYKTGWKAPKTLTFLGTKEQPLSHEWIPVSVGMPKQHTDVHIFLKNNPNHDPGHVIWDDGLSMWCGYNRNFLPKEVSHWKPIQEDE